MKLKIPGVRRLLKSKPKPPVEPAFRIVVEFDPSKNTDKNNSISVSIIPLGEGPTEINMQTVLNVMTTARDGFSYRANRMRFEKETQQTAQSSPSVRGTNE